MDSELCDAVKGLSEGRLTRRDLRKVMAPLGLALVCLPLRPARGLGDQPSYYTWSGYDVPELHQPYVAKYGESPNITLFADQEEALQKLRAGFEVDLAHPCIDDMIKWHDAEILAPIDVSRLKHWEDLWPDLRSMEGVSFEGNVIYVPFEWGNASLLYRSDIYEGEESWAMLFDERYKGRISPWEQKYNVYAAATVLGLDMFNVPEDMLMTQVADLLRKQRDLVRFYWSDPAVAEQAMASGEVVIMHGWNSSYANLKRQGVPVAYAMPKEGIWTWACGITRVRGGKGDEEQVYDFIDAMISPESGKFLLEAYNLGHSNRKAFELADPSILEELVISDPSEIFSQSVFFRPLEPAVDLHYTKLWDLIQAGF